jgi:hypothetical protein
MINFGERALADPGYLPRSLGNNRETVLVDVLRHFYRAQPSPFSRPITLHYGYYKIGSKFWYIGKKAGLVVFEIHTSSAARWLNIQYAAADGDEFLDG